MGERRAISPVRRPRDVPKFAGSFEQVGAIAAHREALGALRSPFAPGQASSSAAAAAPDGADGLSADAQAPRAAARAKKRAAAKKKGAAAATDE